MAYECPGLHGEGTKQRIQPMTFAKLFEEAGKLVIPLFQRAYCWGDSTTIKKDTYHSKGKQVNLAESWWDDIKRANTDATHRVGKIILYRDRNTDPAAKQLLLIDG